MSITDDFLRATGTASGDREMLPSRLAAACTRVLPVAGAGVGMFGTSGIRVPVGSSDENAAAAERLQFTTAQGPCLDAHRSARTVLATESTMAEQWPQFHAALVSRTPFRAVIAVPLVPPLDGMGTVDLYLHNSSDIARVLMADVLEVISAVTRTLAVDGLFGQAAGPLAWLVGPATTGRAAVPVAMGMLTVGLDVTSADALALLRAHAYATNRVVDDLASDIVNRRIPTQHLRLDLNT